MAIELEPARSPTSPTIAMVVVVWLGALSLALAAAWFAYAAVDQAAHATVPPAQSAGSAPPQR